MLESLFDKVAILKMQTLTQVFSSEFCEIFKDTFFKEHLQANPSVFLPTQRNSE